MFVISIKISEGTYQSHCQDDLQSPQTKSIHYCDKCKKSFACEVHLNNHNIIKHPIDKRFECDICQKNIAIKPVSAATNPISYKSQF